MSLVFRRAFALLLLAGAVGASLALPAIFDGSQLADRGALPSGPSPATTQVRVSLPVIVKPHTSFNVAAHPAVASRPAVRHVAPVARPRARVVRAHPAAVAAPIPTAPAPAATPAVPALAVVPTDHVIASVPVPAAPAVADAGSTQQAPEKHGNKGQGGDHGNGNNGNDNGNENSNGDGNGNGNGH